MRRFSRTLLASFVVIAPGVIGFVIGWSIAPPGGLENAYRSAFIGLAGGLALGVVLALALGRIRRRRG